MINVEEEKYPLSVALPSPQIHKLNQTQRARRDAESHIYILCFVVK